MDLSGQKITAGKTVIRQIMASGVVKEGLYMGVAEKAGSCYLVLGQMKLDLITLLLTPDICKAITADDNLFGLHCNIEGEHVDTAWNKLAQAMRLRSTVELDINYNSSEGCPHIFIFYSMCTIHNLLIFLITYSIDILCTSLL